jgi:hypothetical protein
MIDSAEIKTQIAISSPDVALHFRLVSGGVRKYRDQYCYSSKRPSPISADRRTRCGRSVRTCAGTPTPHRTDRSASAYGALGPTRTAPRPAFIRERAESGRSHRGKVAE